jgi:hypothetical protein
MALGMMVVSTITCCMLAFRVTPPRQAALMLATNGVSKLSSLTRMRK